MDGGEEGAAREWAVRLFEKSPLKQEKYDRIVRFIGDVEERTCLDIGSDNGVISLLLREKGGEWYSADLIAETVESIRSLVKERVFQIDDGVSPFETDQFDLVVIVDFLEHIRADRFFVEELHRILKPNGRLVVNVPNPKRGILRRLKYALGQTDEAHGHLRPGYTLEELRELLSGCFKIERQDSYRRLFSDLLDTLITFALDVLKKGGRGQKGTVVTGSDLGKLKKSFRMYSFLYPFIRVFVFFDKIFPFLHGNMLIVCARPKER